ncbi:MAG TPA: esterase-like activity of phytase family protein [Geminicoccaceae bacterium]|nr:esterase-like activity of phytase family protein [Geminicoccaceae bacterium]
MSRRWRGMLALALGLGALCACEAHPEEPLVLTRSIPLQEDAPQRVQLDALRFEAGFQLSSGDSRFGGLSGLWIAPDGHELIMASDHGTIWRAALEHDGDRLVGFAGWRATAIGHVSGDEPGRIDAEALADDGPNLVVAVEGAVLLRRIARDAPEFAEALLAVDGLIEAGATDSNEGIEALTTLPDGALLALSEGVFEAPELLAAWRIEGSRVERLHYRVRDDFVPTGADRLDDTIYGIERRFSLLKGGFTSRVVALDATRVRGGETLAGHVLAELGWPAISENFEGIAARRGTDGRTLLYLISDNNFLALQRTLLLQFSLAGP